jgi:pimeloyl-ACP methyl ester carboxylesterase
VVGDVLRLARDGAGFFGDLGPIACPVRIVYGTRDRIIRWPGHYVRLQRMLPDAEFVALPGLGHLPMWEDPGLVARTILEVSAAGRAVHHHSM